MFVLFLLLLLDCPSKPQGRRLDRFASRKNTTAGVPVTQLMFFVSAVSGKSFRGI
jgi:hypothetical protein